jgi:beta-glucosidase
MRPETAPLRTVPPEQNAARIAQAVALAQTSDVIVLVVGDNEQITREAVAQIVPGDRATLGLFGDQEALVQALAATGKPLVAVLINGRPLSVSSLAAKANALIEGFYLGEQGGHAVADVLFGRVNPGGKLSAAMPGPLGETLAYDRHPSVARYPYVEGRPKPLFPFGHGLSYTRFEISAPRLSKTLVGANEPFHVEVDVTNVGAMDGDEVVQLYIRDEVSSAPRPILELKAFERVTIKRGERRTVRFDLGPQALAFWDDQMRWTVEPGTFQIGVGPSSADLRFIQQTVRA